jgi:hypothetical protein
MALMRAESGDQTAHAICEYQSCPPYSELSLALPSKTPASGDHVLAVLAVRNAALAKRINNQSMIAVAIRPCAKREKYSQANIFQAWSSP